MKCPQMALIVLYFALVHLMNLFIKWGFTDLSALTDLFHIYSGSQPQSLNGDNPLFDELYGVIN